MLKILKYAKINIEKAISLTTDKNKINSEYDRQYASNDTNTNRRYIKKTRCLITLLNQSEDEFYKIKYTGK